MCQEKKYSKGPHSSERPSSKGSQETISGSKRRLFFCHRRHSKSGKNRSPMLFIGSKMKFSKCTVVKINEMFLFLGHKHMTLFVYFIRPVDDSHWHS